MSEQGWLIESALGGQPVWLKESECRTGIHDITTDASRAVRFARKQDAESMIRVLQRSMVIGGEWKATGHEWC